MSRNARAKQQPLTPKGKTTRARLLKAARETFEKLGYREASVSKICRGAGLAMGSFYRYFDDKEQIFLELAGRFSAQLQSELAAGLRVEGDVETRLLQAFKAFALFLQRNRPFYETFREIEFVNRRVHDQLYQGLTRILAGFLREECQRGDLRRVDFDVAAVALIGVAHFLVLQWVILGVRGIPEEAFKSATELILKGIDSGNPVRPPSGPSDSALAMDGASRNVQRTTASKGEQTRHKLLDAAEVCFGRRGFHATSVADITRRAGVSLGTFYIYFSTKIEILAELVQHISARLRRNSQLAVSGLQDRREIEREGFRAFFKFIAGNAPLYRIVREAEFVHPPVARWYFERLAKGYIKGLQAGMKHGDIRRCDSKGLAYSMIGMGHFLGLHWASWANRHPMPEDVFEQTMDLILHGLAARGKVKPARPEMHPAPAV